MAVEVYLTFNGNCREAMEFYAEAFGSAKPEIMSFGEAPPNPDFQLPDEAKNLVMHSRVTISGSNVMASDTYPGSPYTVGNNVSVTVITKDVDELKTAFNKLKEGGKVGMELQETFWSKCYGMLTDKFGVAWQFSHESDETGM
ncbi:VOC family protein [Neobacillus sp. LXY-4]|uniref:VOC family protein n=1 Tax=Neobacillus sp. LXY-4 TaxID=3379826 RepID=UPI003EE2C102